MPKFILSGSAESDIGLIADYTIDKFGINQARKYRNGLLKVFDILAESPGLGRSFFIEGQADLKRYRYESHMIFYTKTESGILIVRILGGAMDFKRHL